MEFELIDSQSELDKLLDDIEAAPIVALDTEAASFHRYKDRVYLVQLSVPGRTAIIDPLGVDNLSGLGELLANPAVGKIFHDADYDIRLFHHEYGFEFRNLLDTRIAAQLSAEPGIGLAALLQKYFDVKPDKRFQRADWSSRPLTEGMLDYAAGDTHNLCELWFILRNNLEQLGRLGWAEEEFGLLEATRWEQRETDPRINYTKLKGARKLERRALAILRELYEWRETTSAQLNRASFRVVGNETLFLLANNPVDNESDLGRVKGIGREAIGRWVGEILAAIDRGVALPEEDLPQFTRGPRHRRDPEQDVRLESLKVRRNKLAESFELLPGVLCPNGILEGIARLNPSSVEGLSEVPGMRRWQREELGEALLKADS